MNIEIGENSKYLDMEQYEAAYNEKATLHRDIIALQNQMDELNDKIEKYEQGSKHNYEVFKEIDKELENNRVVLGTTKVKGEGIKITLNDSPQMENKNSIIHDADIVKVINELRNAGAEAIAVNDHRVIYNTYGLCAGSNIDLNGIKIVAPFYITAIGNKNVIENYIETQENHIKALQRRNCYVEIETLSNLEIPGYNGIITSKYLKDATGKWY